ncbi:hypothetical protein ACFQ21_28780 [Ohtaekwangia kribbensis]|jgi:hypothetical protein|uniref:STAS/SEC14 domain-containing protein n=1 Tax=Ohtaekwangia kribbensis TaxID=688913 RepID=A0ABW3KCM2_9BACT
MTFKTIFQEEHCEITQVGPHALKLKFSGFLKVTNLAAVTAFMDTYSKNNLCDMLLIDHSELKVLSREVQEYLAKVVFVIESKGVKRIAVIEAEDVFAKAGFEKLQKGIHVDRVTRVVFHSEKAALEWLLSPTVTPVL